ncbi:MAG: VOC family protein [Alphaproteobacteria bacterium]|nr:VOC family protein [Alphaproteobacteria bacterium]
MATLNHLHLHVRSVEQAKAFYETHFGLREHVRHGDVVFLRDDGGMDLALAPSPQPDVMPPWFHFGFRLATPEAVRTLHAALPADAIAEPLSDAPDFTVFRCRDPDGHLIEVYWEPQPA